MRAPAEVAERSRRALDRARVAFEQTDRRGFEPNGLPGYRVFRDPKWAGSQYGDWWFTLPADVPSTFDWDEATKDHTTPVYRDWAIGPRKTAKGAVAAAHKHAEWAAEQMERAACARRLAILKPAPLPPRPPIDFAAVKVEADRLYASGYRATSHAGFATSIALANRMRLRAED